MIHNNERANRARMFMSHPHDFSKTSMIHSLYLVGSPYFYVNIFIETLLDGYFRNKDF